MNRAHFDLKLRKDRPKKDGTYGIYLYANLNGKLAWYSTNHSVKEKEWNVNKQEVKAICTNWSDINSDIKLYKSKASDYLTECNLNNEIITRQSLDKRLRSIAYQANSYYDFVESYYTKHKNNYAIMTYKGFKTHLNKLKEYKSKLNFDEINPAFWRGYEAYLKGKGNFQNTIHKQGRLFKKFLNKAVEFGVLKENPLKDVKVKNKEGNRQYLTIKEVNELQDLYNSNKLKKGFSTVLKCFLFACYTSLRYNDIKELKYKHIINGDSIDIIASKTGKRVRIPLSEKAKGLIGSETLPNDNVFRVFTNQVINRHLKDIIDETDINKTITFHCARHTWATITLELTGDIALVSDVLGHTSIRTTQIYAKVLENKKREAMNKWDSI